MPWLQECRQKLLNSENKTSPKVFDNYYISNIFKNNEDPFENDSF